MENVQANAATQAQYQDGIMENVQDNGMLSSQEYGVFAKYAKAEIAKINKDIKKKLSELEYLEHNKELFSSLSAKLSKRII